MTPDELKEQIATSQIEWRSVATYILDLIKGSGGTGQYPLPLVYVKHGGIVGTDCDYNENSFPLDLNNVHIVFSDGDFTGIGGISLTGLVKIDTSPNTQLDLLNLTGSLYLFSDYLILTDVYMNNNDLRLYNGYFRLTNIYGGSNPETDMLFYNCRFEGGTTLDKIRLSNVFNAYLAFFSTGQSPVSIQQVINSSIYINGDTTILGGITNSEINVILGNNWTLFINCSRSQFTVNAIQQSSGGNRLLLDDTTGSARVNTIEYNYGYEGSLNLIQGSTNIIKLRGRTAGLTPNTSNWTTQAIGW